MGAKTGDFNGDGNVDIVITTGIFRNWSLIVHYGPVSEDITQVSMFQGIPGNTSVFVSSGLGFSGTRGFGKLFHIEDITNDGYDELIFVNDAFPNVGGGIGNLFIYFGTASLWPTKIVAPADFDGTTGIIILRDIISTAYGWDFKTQFNLIGDVNNDGYNDLLTTYNAYRTSIGDPQCGGGFIIYGNSTASFNQTTYDLEDLNAKGRATYYYGQTPQLGFGHSSGPVGDVNGDGVPDIFISYKDWVSQDTELYILTGKTDGTILPDANFAAINSTSYASIKSDGYNSIILTGSLTGDLNNDGDLDFVIGAVFKGGGIPLVYGILDITNVVGLHQSLESLAQATNNFNLTMTPGFGNVLRIIPLGDVTQDGLDDFTVRLATSIEGETWYGRNSFPSQFAASNSSMEGAFISTGSDEIQLNPRGTAQLEDGKNFFILSTETPTLFATLGGPCVYFAQTYPRCSSGYYLSSDSCQPCPLNSSNPFPNSSPNCTGGTIEICGAGNYRLNGVCTPCPTPNGLGFYNVAGGETSECVFQLNGNCDKHFYLKVTINSNNIPTYTCDVCGEGKENPKLFNQKPSQKTTCERFKCPDGLVPIATDAGIACVRDDWGLIASTGISSFLGAGFFFLSLFAFKNRARRKILFNTWGVDEKTVATTDIGKFNINVLSIDGGSTNGIVPVLLLKELENICGGVPTQQMFHLIAGTST